MKLPEDLRFTAEDFRGAIMPDPWRHMKNDELDPRSPGERLLDHANALLAARFAAYMARQVEVWGEKISLVYDDQLLPRLTWTWVEEPSLFERPNSHRARLCMIEPIKEPRDGK